MRKSSSSAFRLPSLFARASSTSVQRVVGKSAINASTLDDARSRREAIRRGAAEERHIASSHRAVGDGLGKRGRRRGALTHAREDEEVEEAAEDEEDEDDEPPNPKVTKKTTPPPVEEPPKLVKKAAVKKTAK